MKKSELLGILRNDSSFNGRSDSELVDLLDHVLDDMVGAHRTREIALSGNGFVTVIEYGGAFPHVRLKWASRNNGYLLNNQVFDTMFDGIEMIMQTIDENDAEIMWKWYLEHEQW